MNIIISSLADIRITGQSADFDSTKLFISKSIENLDSINITLTQGNASYPLVKILSPALEKDEFLGYRLTSKVSIGDGVYTVNIDGIGVKEGFTVINNEESLNKLIDEHEPIYIIGRNINPVTAQIVAQDANSQQFTFYIKKKYDGISFLDESKKVYIDFVPVDKKDADGNEVEFLSDPIPIENILEITPPKGQQDEWLCLKWDLPYDATKLAGSVKFALSVIHWSAEARKYTWQTIPSAFTVLPNIGFRKSLVLTEEEESVLSGLIEEVDALKEDVEALESLVDADIENDEDILLNGGKAPIAEEV